MASVMHTSSRQPDDVKVANPEEIDARDNDDAIDCGDISEISDDENDGDDQDGDSQPKTGGPAPPSPELGDGSTRGMDSHLDAHGAKSHSDELIRNPEDDD